MDIAAHTAAAHSFAIVPETPPFQTTPEGVVRIGTTRVPIETVIYAFNQGHTPESIVDQYPTVSLSQVYATIAYYLAHRVEVEEYLDRRRTQSAEVRRAVETRCDQSEIRERLLARKTGG